MLERAKQTHFFFFTILNLFSQEKPLIFFKMCIDNCNNLRLISRSYIRQNGKQNEAINKMFIDLCFYKKRKDVVKQSFIFYVLQKQNRHIITNKL